MIVSLLIIIIIHINIISIYSLLHILSNVSRKDAKVSCRGIAFFLFFFLLHSLFTRVCASLSEVYVLSPPPPFLRGKGWIWSFFSSTITSLTYVTQYIYIMYISIMSNIYIIHIYLSPCKFTMARICSSIALIYFALFFFFIFPENITKIYS